MRKAFDQLAIFGGAPAFPQPLHVGRPNIGDEARLFERIRDALARRWLTNDGPYVQAFEKEVAQVLGVRNCVAVCNCTLALELAARGLGLEGEVIVPAFTFVGTAHALSWQGITPVFCDVDPATHTLDTRHVEALITPRTSAIVGVHVWGRPCDTVDLEAIARRHGLALLFDAAHGFGCSHSGRMLGSFGDAEVLSFHATKVVNAFEGGAIVTDDDALADRLRLLRNFGFAGPERVVSLGTNAKMSEVSAAMGLTSLESRALFFQTNRANLLIYADLLLEIAGLHVAKPRDGELANYHYVVVEVDEDRAGLSRDTLLAVLQAEGVLARRYFFPGCHRMEPYRSESSEAGTLPETDRLVQRVMQLPSGTAIGGREIGTIAELVRMAVGAAPALRKWLQAEGRAVRLPRP